MVGRAFYEVFRAHGIPGAPRSRAWTWQRTGRAGMPLAQGCHYRSLQECFAALRLNRIELGMAPVRINLHGASLRDVSAIVAMSVGERDVTIADMGPGPSPRHA
jgi:hypothetical protein